MLATGDKAPDFSLPGQDGKSYGLKDFAGRVLVLYIYPKDFTPGCSLEAREFSRLQAEFAKAGAVVVGLSKDTVATHADFRRKEGLDFLLLSDPEGETIRAYGAFKPKSMFGKTFLGVNRSTFVIDGNGIVTQAMYGVSPQANPGEVCRLVAEKAGK